MLYLVFRLEMARIFLRAGKITGEKTVHKIDILIREYSTHGSAFERGLFAPRCQSLSVRVQDAYAV